MVETLADLVNDHKFVKVSSAKILCSILNNVQIRPSLFCQLCFCSEFAKVSTHQSFPPYGIMNILYPNCIACIYCAVSSHTISTVLIASIGIFSKCMLK